MTITNGYCTLAQARDRILEENTLTGATISFALSTKKIADSARGMKRFLTGDIIRVSGSVSNNGTFTVATGGVAAEVVVTETLVNENAGATVTISVVNDQTDDAIIESIVTAVSRQIDLHCRRRFFTTAEDEVRYYTPESANVLFCEDDIISIATLKTDGDGDRVYEATWQTTDFDLMPFNAALESNPYTSIRITPAGSHRFPTIQKSTQITGKFGFSACPALISEACMLQSARLFRRKDAPFGIAGSGEMGQAVVIPMLDPDVKMMLMPYRRVEIL